VLADSCPRRRVPTRAGAPARSALARPSSADGAARGRAERRYRLPWMSARGRARLIRVTCSFLLRFRRGGIDSCDQMTLSASDLATNSRNLARPCIYFHEAPA
jgi:hypothetical protein